MLVLLGTGLAAWLWVRGHSIEAELERIREAGEPVNLAELMPAAPSESEEDAGRYYAAAVRVIDSQAEGRDKARKVREAFRSGTLTSVTPEQAQAVRELLERNAEALSLLDRGAVVEACRLVVAVLPGASLSYDEHAGKLMRLAQLAKWRAALRAYEGDALGAVESTMAALRLGRVFNGSPLAGAMMRNACLDIAAQSAAVLAGLLATADQDLRNLADLLHKYDDPDSFRQAMLAERVYGLALMGIVPGGESLPNFMLPTTVPRPVLKLMGRSYVRYFAALVEATGEPWPDVLDAVAKVKPRGLYAGMIPAESFVRGLVLTGRTLVSLRAARLAILIELYRREHGQPPEALRHLVPKFCEALPVDPFDGKPLKYKREGNTITIYSVYQNRTDDGGVIEPQDPEPPDWGVRVQLR